jgi:hypothetical protein
METIKGNSITASNYVGDKTKIESAKIERMRHGEVVRILSEKIAFKGDDKLPEDKDLRASKLLGLGQTETGELAVIESSKMDKFLKEKNIKIENDYSLGDNIKELIGVECTIQKTDDGFLELA